jgi:hypothetical protein
MLVRVISYSVSHHKDKEHEDQEKYQRVIIYQRNRTQRSRISSKSNHIPISKKKGGNVSDVPKLKEKNNIVMSLNQKNKIII